MGSQVVYDTPTAPQSDGLLGVLSFHLDRLDVAIAKLQTRVTEITGPDYVEEKVAVQDEPLTEARKLAIRLGDLVDALNATTSRIDI